MLSYVTLCKCLHRYVYKRHHILIAIKYSWYDLYWASKVLLSHPRFRRLSADLPVDLCGAHPMDSGLGKGIEALAVACAIWGMRLDSLDDQFRTDSERGLPVNQKIKSKFASLWTLNCLVWYFFLPKTICHAQSVALGVLTNMVMPSCWTQSLLEHLLPLVLRLMFVEHLVGSWRDLWVIKATLAKLTATGGLVKESSPKGLEWSLNWLDIRWYLDHESLDITNLYMYTPYI